MVEMSLINQMLKDIDKRQGVNATAFSDADGLRLQAPRQEDVWLKRGLVWAGFALVAVAAVGYGLGQWSAPVASVPPLAKSPMDIKRPTPAAPIAPVNATMAVPAPAPAPAPTPAVSRDPVPELKPQRVRDEVKHVVQAAKSKIDVEDVAAVVPTPAPKKEAVAAVEGTVTRQLSTEQRADNTYREAATLMRQGRGVEAQKLLQHILIDLPAHQDARLLLARVWVEDGKWVEAKTLLAEGVALKPQAFPFYSALAHVQLLAKEVDSAVATLERGLPAAGENAEYQALLATALQQQTRHSEAVQHYVIALRQLPDTPNWLVGLGVSLQALNNSQGAAEAYQRALELGLPASLAMFARDKLNQLKR